jgi:hypothetical protein
MDLAEILDREDGVLDVPTALRFLTPAAMRWQIRSGRWQQPCRGVVVAHSGPLTEQQRMRTALLWAGDGAVLAGLTAARLEGFRWSNDHDAVREPLYVLVPAKRSIRRELPGLNVVVR